MESIIVAYDNNKLIGKGNTLPWHIPEDLKRFKELTTGNTIIMGRKTYESIGRPLPNRTNIVITRNPDYKLPKDGKTAIWAVDSLAAALQQSRNHAYIIGGAEIFAQAIPLVNTMHITHIFKNFEGDVYFPHFDTFEWNIENAELINSQGIVCSFQTWTRFKPV